MNAGFAERCHATKLLYKLFLPATGTAVGAVSCPGPVLMGDNSWKCWSRKHTPGRLL